MTAADASPPAAPSPSRSVVAAGVIGNVMEWFDFAIYGYFAPTLGKLFFPSNDPTVSLIAAFGVFAAGYLMRPLGGLVFGHIGDRLGRRTTLLISSLAMGFPTFLIGLLPTYAAIGFLGALILMVLRLIQGLSVGGEYTGSAVFIAEHAPPARRGFFASWIVWGAVAGILLGSAAGAAVTSVLSPAAIEAWGWRLPFLSGLIVALYGLMLRRRTLADEAPARHETMPIVIAFRDHWRAILQTGGVSLLNGVGFYMMFVYAVTYLREIVHVGAAEALDINTLNMAAMLIAIPLFGRLSDRVGRKTVMIIAALVTAAFAWPLFALLHSGIGVLIFCGQFGFAVLLGAYLSVNPVIMTESFPPEVRCSAVSVAYNVTLGLFGGTVPIVATYLVQRSHNDLSPAYYIMAAALLSAAALFTMRETAPAIADQS